MLNSYAVTLATPAGEFVVELNGSSARSASERAKWSLVAARYGDVDEVEVVEVVEVDACRYSVSCVNAATASVVMPFGVVPMCDDCQALYARLR
jgi:hypothetical protein